MSNELKSKLSPLAYQVTQEQGTEPPFSGKYDSFDQAGDYACICCDQYLFSSEHKFQSSCGWPAFFDTLAESVEERRDLSHGMVRTEVVCKNCHAHLGHKFPDGPHGTRYCINSVALNFKPKKE